MKRKKQVRRTCKTSLKAKKNCLQHDGISAEALSPTCLKITAQGQTRTIDLPKPEKARVSYRSDNHVLTALYAMAIHELQEDTTADGHLVAGAAWSTVWTRDIAYSTDLGLHLVAPHECKESLISRVRDGVILQDTGTGGGWPISTDRVSWALGAWAYYQSSGDKKWLHYCIDVLKNTIDQDDAILRKPGVSLIPGETSFLDWREQSYPDWMSMADIGSCYAFSTNLLHCICRRILSSMLIEVGRSYEAAVYAKVAAELTREIQKHFYDKDKKRYNMLITRCGIADKRTDTLATALAVINGVADPQTLASLPRTPYGTPVFAPFKSSVPSAYHNRAIWPFVESYVLRAHAEQGDVDGAEKSMLSLIRAALAFGTNKENFHATTGAAQDTIQNSDRQLWSVAGMFGLFFHGLLGLQFKPGYVELNPCVPKAFAGKHKFSHIKIRKMQLSVRISGQGSVIDTLTINGQPAKLAQIPIDTKGRVDVRIQLKPAETPVVIDTSSIASDALPAPQWDSPNGSHLSWHAVPKATYYEIYAGDTLLMTTRGLSHDVKLAHRTTYREFYLRACNAHRSSCLSAPHEFISKGSRLVTQPSAIGENGEYSVDNNQAWLDTRSCTSKLFYEPIVVRPGTYRVRVCYSNATASMRDGDTCALRELYLDGASVGIIALPHNTEAGQWEDYSLSAPVTIRIKDTEKHQLALHYTPACINGNREVNQCMVRHLELTRIS